MVSWGSLWFLWGGMGLSTGGLELPPDPCEEDEPLPL